MEILSVVHFGIVEDLETYSAFLSPVYAGDHLHRITLKIRKYDTLNDHLKSITYKTIGEAEKAAMLKAFGEN